MYFVYFPIVHLFLPTVVFSFAFALAFVVPEDEIHHKHHVTTTIPTTIDSESYDSSDDRESLHPIIMIKSATNPGYAIVEDSFEDIDNTWINVGHESVYDYRDIGGSSNDAHSNKPFNYPIEDGRNYQIFYFLAGILGLTLIAVLIYYGLRKLGTHVQLQTPIVPACVHGRCARQLNYPAAGCLMTGSNYQHPTSQTNNHLTVPFNHAANAEETERLDVPPSYDNSTRSSIQSDNNEATPSAPIIKEGESLPPSYDEALLEYAHQRFGNRNDNLPTGDGLEAYQRQ